MKDQFDRLAERRKYHADLAERIGVNLRRLKAMSDDDILYLHSKWPDEIVFIQDYFGVSYDNFSRVVNDANSKTGVFERHRSLDRSHGSIDNGLHWAFIYRKLNEEEYQILEGLVPKMKKLDSECFTFRTSLPNGYERIYADTRAGPNAVLSPF